MLVDSANQARGKLLEQADLRALDATALFVSMQSPAAVAKEEGLAPVSTSFSFSFFGSWQAASAFSSFLTSSPSLQSTPVEGEWKSLDRAPLPPCTCSLATSGGHATCCRARRTRSWSVLCVRS